MSLIPSNLQSNSLSGTVRVSGGYANIVLGISKYAFEEREKTFTLKLRRDGFDGPVLATSNVVTLTDFSEIISLTVDSSTVAEGNIAALTLVTANVVDGANVYYSVLPVTANVTASDFFGANSGVITISNNQSTIFLEANTDSDLIDETGETFRIQIRTISETGNVVFLSSNIEILDLFKTYNIFRFEESSASIVEGSSVTFTIFAHNIPTGTPLYYYTSGDIIFNGANSGSVIMNSESNVISLTTAQAIPSGETRTFTLNLSETDFGTPLITSNTIAVSDQSLAYLDGTGGTISTIDGYKIHKFTTSGSLDFTNAESATFNNVDVLVVAGGGGGGFGAAAGGGGGAGGLIYQEQVNISSNLTITVGAGGGAATSPGVDLTHPGAAKTGSNSTITGTAINLIAFGGGAGSSKDGTIGGPGGPGGSGGGGVYGGEGGANVINQGNFGGGPSGINAGSGGGGSELAGSGGPAGNGGKGGNGKYILSFGGNVAYAGGGGGAGSSTGGLGGSGGGGPGGQGPGISGTAGTVNTGGGGGAGATTNASAAAAGGSGIVIIRYPWNPTPQYLSITSNTNSFFNNTSITFSVNTAFANASTLYYTTLGNVTTNSFVGGNTGSFVVTGNTTSLTLTAPETLQLSDLGDFVVQIREGYLGGDVVLTSNVITLTDLSLYINATGGNLTSVSGYRIHTFTSSDTFTVTNFGSPSYNSIEMLVVGGGGGAGLLSGTTGGSGGGGAGGLLYYGSQTTANRAVPNGSEISVLDFVSNISSNVVIVIGGGGAAGATPPTTVGGTSGTPTTISKDSNIIYNAIGGGGGEGYASSPAPSTLKNTYWRAKSGGSGGGGGVTDGPGIGGSGTPGQGNPGGNRTNPAAAGGGGAGAHGAPAAVGVGGVGLAYNFTGASTYYAGGGGGGNSPLGTGGLGGGGDASFTGGISGAVNTGGGGGGGVNITTNGAGGSGIVIIRYPYPQ